MRKNRVTRWGTIKIDYRTMETSVPGVFAAGDIVRGASIVVWAIKMEEMYLNRYQNI